MKKIVVLGILIVLLVVVGAVMFKDQLGLSGMFASPEVSTEEPLDVALNFYDAWHAAVESTTTDPVAAGLYSWPTLTKSFKKQLTDGALTSGVEYGALDSVMCQTVVPNRLVAKTLYVDSAAGTAKVLVFSKTDEPTGEAIVTLVQEKTGWHIDEVQCSRGEFDVAREFSFDMTGNLLKSVPSPYDSQYWHIVFTQNGETGHAAPLFFTDQSQCVTADGATAVCVPDTFAEAAPVHVQGQMTELGVEVSKITFLQ